MTNTNKIFVPKVNSKNLYYFLTTGTSSAAAYRSLNLLCFSCSKYDSLAWKSGYQRIVKTFKYSSRAWPYRLWSQSKKASFDDIRNESRSHGSNSFMCSWCHKWQSFFLVRTLPKHRPKPKPWWIWKNHLEDQNIQEEGV